MKESIYWYLIIEKIFVGEKKKNIYIYIYNVCVCIWKYAWEVNDCGYLFLERWGNGKRRDDSQGERKALHCTSGYTLILKLLPILAN